MFKIFLNFQKYVNEIKCRTAIRIVICIPGIVKLRVEKKKTCKIIGKDISLVVSSQKPSFLMSAESPRLATDQRIRRILIITLAAKISLCLAVARKSVVPSNIKI